MFPLRLHANQRRTNIFDNIVADDYRNRGETEKVKKKRE